MKLLQQIELIERLDQLIRLKATGNPNNLAAKLEVSEATIYRAIEAIKSMGAPVEFSIRYQSYIYSKEVNFMCGFFMKELTTTEIKKVNGGFGHLTYFLNF